ncbi:hypothetical protein MGN01_02210 [Methylobacterium gnaphalii]|uniref:Uncharacterized protein n=1 Tax=Methylobacterium gnaphalii TaxID=1010610 RepID=A0A512JEK1_9HYPH|nr:hypothetical protein MGN01_02210 [Methylobacterium gnaphalii]GLS47435.1 hypothetical protein GCM10007885_02790 [Methylobacterium gnaphalii]
MTRVLLIGYAPDAVDFSDPALPPGMNANKIAAGIEVGSSRCAIGDGTPNSAPSGPIMRSPR